MSDPGQSRSEQATPKQREEARKKGQSATSSDLSTGMILLLMILLLINTSPMIGRQLQTLVSQGLSASVSWQDWSMLQFIAVGRVSTSLFIQIAAVMTAGSFVAGILANVLQSGVMISPQALEFKISRLSPASGIKKIFSVRGAMRTLMAALKFVFCAAAIIGAYYLQRDGIRWTTVLDVVATAWYTSLYAGLAGSLILILLGLFDYLFQRWQFEEDLKMTQQQVKDEHKETQGDPKIKAMLRRRQAEAAKARSLAQVPKASVVITNPTHLSIAIRYDRHTMAAPIVVAKGEGVMAFRIRERAKQAGVPLRENKPLARALYASTDVGDEIPTSLYRAVAEILGMIYKMRRPR